MVRDHGARLLLAAAAAVLAATMATAQAQAPFAQPPYKNIQVLATDITRDQLLWNMRFFSQSLGVRCSHCHVGVEGQPLSTFDFASDAKEAKRTARKMLAMVHRINREDFGVREFKDVKVTCFTCHRGSTEPLTGPPPAPPPAPAATERGAH
jgi:hypothetical protein